ncbi:hypothetical protein [Pantoea sp. BAV 3049]|uniref:hypothetical protein n=1 Tax=Pantoea sp. BAV 3049 TaxID=2654188 RepID=UPI001E2C4FA3|nr:hypothetical protein [Pantoea sp. BAV 3049]
MKKIKLTALVISILTLLPLSVHASSGKSSLQCKKEALVEAKKLLSFYRDNDERIVIDDDVTPLTKIKNPENKKQIFDVLEVWGNIYKGKYRMRFLYYPDDCLLMGEEILEYANL